MTRAGMMMSMFRGGMHGQQRLFLLKSRLHLSADQEAAIKAAMDADGKARRALARQMFGGGKVDPQAAANADTLDKTLASVLTPEQQAAYQQVQADEKTSRADTEATVQVNQVTPLLQLSDSQKEQVFNALYQVQASAPDPISLMTNPNAATVIAAQAQATQDALAKVLTPDQMALYQQEGQTVSQFGGFGGGRRGGGNGGGGAPPAGGTPPAP
jgi:Spy/CpxP family protein refolding chaperone